MKQSKWYDNIPKKGIICWVWDIEGSVKDLTVIIDYSNGLFLSAENGWKFAEPVKPEECYKNN